ncbi:hypothetical protein NDU88_004657 [Pleurodeles waltl]|uniref:Uncharacterized protein n=1 Tax=Pleurodeles waltl TaxID=8319 RepID=A0AAV7TUT5_PLEWA|nr:hypothetical protein NDU88_004657 [Pleurodeles waltl]
MGVAASATDANAREQKRKQRRSGTGRVGERESGRAGGQERRLRDTVDTGGRPLAIQPEPTVAAEQGELQSG